MANASRSFTAAVIGLGFIGAGDQVSGDAIGQQVASLDGTHASALAAHPSVRLVSGSSRDLGRRQRFAERLGVKNTYEDWRELIAAEKPDIVSIATNSPYHAEITIACAEAGIRAVICEKPIATKLSDADRAIAACRKSGTLLVVNHSRRWHPLWIRVRDEVANGAVGEICHAVVTWSGGRLGNIGTHLFDLLHMVMRDKSVAVSGSLDPLVLPDCRGEAYCDPGGWGVVRYANGAKAFVNAVQRPALPVGVTLVGSLGQISVRGSAASLDLWKGGSRSIVPDAKQGETSLDRAVQSVVQFLEGGEPPESLGEEGLAALEVIVGFHVSNRQNGRWVPLPVGDVDRALQIAIG